MPRPLHSSLVPEVGPLVTTRQVHGVGECPRAFLDDNIAIAEEGAQNSYVLLYDLKWLLSH